MSWLRGMLSSLLLIAIGAISFTIYTEYGLLPAASSIGCTLISGLFMLILIGAYENDNFAAGVVAPFVALAGFALAYFMQPPVEPTLGSSFLGALIGLILLMEG